MYKFAFILEYAKVEKIKMVSLGVVFLRKISSEMTQLFRNLYFPFFFLNFSCTSGTD